MQRIFFTDNFYYLRNRIRVLEELLGLEINGEFFNVQIMEEVRNLSRLLSDHEYQLRKSKQLQNYAELVSMLLRIKQVFLEFLLEVQRSKQDFMLDLIKTYGREWGKLVRQCSKENEQLICELEGREIEPENQGMVSDAELEMLFQPADDEDKL